MAKQQRKEGHMITGDPVAKKIIKEYLKYFERPEMEISEELIKDLTPATINLLSKNPTLSIDDVVSDWINKDPMELITIYSHLPGIDEYNKAILRLLAKICPKI